MKKEFRLNNLEVNYSTLKRWILYGYEIYFTPQERWFIVRLVNSVTDKEVSSLIDK